MPVGAIKSMSEGERFSAQRFDLYAGRNERNALAETSHRRRPEIRAPFCDALTERQQTIKELEL